MERARYDTTFFGENGIVEFFILLIMVFRQNCGSNQNGLLCMCGCGVNCFGDTRFDVKKLRNSSLLMLKM